MKAEKKVGRKVGRKAGRKVGMIVRKKVGILRRLD